MLASAPNPPAVADVHVTRTTMGHCFTPSVEADAVTTMIVQNALRSAANQMKRTVIRTAFSPTVYETLDFAVVLYDRHVRLLAQAATLPAFMGTMGFCIRAAVDAVGGEQKLNAGDVLVYNRPYNTGSHAPDAAIIVPIFLDNGELVGYAANKCHWADIGAQAIYCTNTTDVYQEGVVIPGVKLYQKGVLNEELYRMLLANSRFAEAVDGDIRAQIASCRVGARELVRVVERFGVELFEAAVERMFDHGEAVVRNFLKNVPDGEYRGVGWIDDNGVADEQIPVEVAVRVSGSNVIVDFSNAPAASPGPINCPLPSTVSSSRISIAMIAGGAAESANEGHFRALEVITRPGTMYHPVEPQPCFLYGWAIAPAMEAIFQALSGASKGLVPSGCSADIGAVIYSGVDSRTSKAFHGGNSLPCGHGASASSDGAILFISALAHSQAQSPELQEAKLPIRYDRWEMLPDTAGPGRFRGGSGWESTYTLIDPVLAISIVEGQKSPGWAQEGGLPGTANRLTITRPGGVPEQMMKATDVKLPAGTRVQIRLGGGGGYGKPEERCKEAILCDLRDGIISEAHAWEYYGHASG